MVDIHTHIMPGVDDGARTMDNALEMARIAAADGITTMAATPHAYWMGDIIEGREILERVKEVNIAIQEAGIPLKVVSGCEVPMDRRLVERLRDDAGWTYCGSNVYLLLEPPWGSLPENCFSLVDGLLERGITPVIAHPERNAELQSDLAPLDRLIQQGCLAQVNANSILGRHGRPAKATALRLVETQRLHIVASDSHNIENRAPILSEARAYVERVLGAEAGERLFVENPQRVVDGLPLYALPHSGSGVEDRKRGFLSRIFGKRR